MVVWHFKADLIPFSKHMKQQVHVDPGLDKILKKRDDLIIPLLLPFWVLTRLQSTHFFPNSLLVSRSDDVVNCFVVTMSLQVQLQTQEEEKEVILLILFHLHAYMCI